MSTEIDRSVKAMDAASEMLEKLAAELERLSPHKGSDLPEDAKARGVFVSYNNGGHWFQCDFCECQGTETRWAWHHQNNGCEINLSIITHWMRVPEVET